MPKSAKSSKKSTRRHPVQKPSKKGARKPKKVPKRNNSSPKRIPKSDIIKDDIRSIIKKEKKVTSEVEKKSLTLFHNAKEGYSNFKLRFSNRKTENGEEPISQFLITYGWAIIVILAAVIFPFYSGLSLPTFMIETCSIRGSISCDSFNLTENRIILNLQNKDRLVATSISEVADEENSCRLKEDKLISNITSLTFSQDGSRGSCSDLLGTEKIIASINLTLTDINLTESSALGKLRIRRR